MLLLGNLHDFVRENIHRTSLSTVVNPYNGILNVWQSNESNHNEALMYRSASKDLQTIVVKEVLPIVRIKALFPASLHLIRQRFGFKEGPGFLNI